MNAKGFAGTHVSCRPISLFWVHVGLQHHGSGRVSTNGYDREIERAQLVTNFSEAREIAAVTGIVDPSFRAGNRPRGPQSPIVIRERALAPMLAG